MVLEKTQSFQGFEMIKFLIKAYSFIVSPFTGPTCRFHPTCSAYGLEAVEKHGALKGVFLILRRISKCHPWGACESFTDPVPERFDWRGLVRYNRVKDHQN